MSTQSERRIIDIDVDFYAAEVEECSRRLRMCHTSEERYWRNRREYAQRLHEALTIYRTALDAPRS